MDPIYAWALSFITTMAPATQPQYFKDAKESLEEGTARRESIAKDVVDVVYADTLPPLFTGPTGRAQEVPLVLSLMQHESGFRRDVDLGIGPAARGDGGRSWCMMQIQVGGGRTGDWNVKKGRFFQTNDPADEIVKGWTGAELVGDRRKCITAGLRIIRLSFSSTSGMDVMERLRVYASGKVDAGSEASHKRMGLAVKWFSAHPVPDTDDNVVKRLFTPTTEPTTTVSMLPFPSAA